MTAAATPGPSRPAQALTFGCRLNAHESDEALAAAAAAGLNDALIVNTCAVTGEAVRQARQAIRKARREQPGVRIVATGCAVQIDPEAFAAMSEVDLVLGNGLKTAREAYAPAAFARRVNVPDLSAAEVGPPAGGHQTAAPARAFSSPDLQRPARRARDFVAVQNGCDHRCTFCVIPFGRGYSRSLPPTDVVRRVRALRDQGVKEAVMTGVDLTAWGQDLPGQPSLGALVALVLRAVPDLPRLRLSSIDAAEIDPELLACMASEPRLMPHLHLSLQSGDDMILKRMKRRHCRSDALELIDAVRKVRPNTAFGADLIAGFPTETEAMFDNSLSLIEAAGLAYVHVFPFSPRPGTPAARMPQLDRAVVRARAERLRIAAAGALERHLMAKVGQDLKVLMEEPGRARAEDFAEVTVLGEDKPGSLAVLRVEGQDGRRLIGRVVTAS